MQELGPDLGTVDVTTGRGRSAFGGSRPGEGGTGVLLRSRDAAPETDYRLAAKRVECAFLGILGDCWAATRTAVSTPTGAASASSTLRLGAQAFIEAGPRPWALEMRVISARSGAYREDGVRKTRHVP